MIRQLLAKVLGVPSNAGKRTGPPRHFRPRVELLETRTVPATLVVNAGGSIQAAVDAAGPGDTIDVMPGTYVEQIIISTDNLTLQSTRRGAAIIQAPATLMGPYYAIVEERAQNVTIDGFTVTGQGSGDPSNQIFGIFVDNGGSATISHNHITQIELPSVFGVQTGVAILVGRQSLLQTGSATITDNTIDHYQKGGIVIDNVGSHAVIDNNTVTGIGPTPLIGQNGIQVSRGATAIITRNTVTGNVYTNTVAPDFWTAAGILLYQSGTVELSNNTVKDNQIGIDLDGTSGATLSNNTVKGNSLDGISLEGGSTGNMFTRNTITRNDQDGVIVSADSSDNTFSRNKLKHNTILDAEDHTLGGGTAGTANFWDHNKIGKSSPGGLP